MAFLRRASYLLEADDDDNTDSPINGDDTSNEGDYETPDDNTEESQDDGEEQQDNNEEENQDDQGDENSEEETSNEDDYNMPEDDTESEDSNEENNDDSSDSDSNMDTDSEDKQIDRDMFETLSDEEKKQKIITLKRLYLDLYEKCDHIIERYNNVIDQYENFAQVGKRVIMVLMELKTYVADYVLKLYDSKSYIENDINYNRCISILNGIKMVTNDIAKAVKDEEK